MKKSSSYTTTGYLSSASGNISGVYDMSGGVHEYVMGVKADAAGKLVSGRNKTYHSGFTGTLSCPTCDGLDGSTTSVTGEPFHQQNTMIYIRKIVIGINVNIVF